MSSSGAARRSPPTASPASMASSRNARKIACSAPTSLIETEVYDECNTIVDIAGIARRIAAAKGGFVALVGVQSNQFPRALDIGRRFRALGVTVAVGGFHVSGCIAMLPELPADLKAAQALGMILFAGEGEGRLAGLLHGHRRRPAPTGLQLPERHAGNGLGRDPRAAAGGRDAGRRPLHQFRRRARLPVPVQLLHHHQRPGPNLALSHPRRRRGDRARQRRPGRHAVLCHRRQFRPQPQLGADPRPADQAARSRRLQDQASVAGRHALPPHSGLHREGGASRLQRGLHRPREHQPQSP